jgi:transketolase
MTTDDTPFEIGRARVVWTSQAPQVGIVATGALLHNALRAARALHDGGIEVEVMNLATIKPLDEDALEAFARRSGRIVTVEEHQIRGGMGSAVAECLVQRAPVPMRFIGVNDRFGQSGTPQELIEFYGMGADAIVGAVRQLLLVR